MRRASLALATAALSALLATAPAHADQLDTVKSRATLRCGVSSNYVPFSFVADPQTRKLVGYDIDMCEEIARAIGVKSEYVIVTGAGRIQDLIQDRIDVSISAITITPARAEQVAFSQPYFRTGVAISVPTERGLTNLASLAGKRIAVTEGGMAGQTIGARVPNARITGYPTTANAFLALEQGKVDAMAGDDTTLMGLMSTSSGKFALLPDRLSDDALGIAARKGEKALIDAVNTALAEMEKSGRAETSFARWFGDQSKLRMTRSFRVDGR